MTDEPTSVFPNLTPPPGGLEKLHQRLDRESDSNWMRQRTPALALGIAFLCLAAWLIASQIHSRKKPDQITQTLALLKSESHPVLVRFGLADPPAEAVTLPVGQRRYMTLQRVTVSDPNVIYYRISMLDKMDADIPPEDH